MDADILNNVTDAGQETWVVQHGLTHGNAVAAELAGISKQSSRMRQRTHRHRPIVGGHAAECVARYQSCLCAQFSRAERRHHTRGSCTDNTYIHRALYAAAEVLPLAHAHAVMSHLDSTLRSATV